MEKRVALKWFFTACLAAAGVFFTQGIGLAVQDNVELGNIVVTPSRYEQDINESPSDVTVITDADIASTDAKNITEVLAPTAGLEIIDQLGNGVKPIVNMRGFFGDTAAYNVLVLVDGRRINAADQSGVDWTQIPLQEVKRVEVLHGGGSVLYGDNAVGGVINIITKNGEGKPHAELSGEAGSYDTNNERLAFSGANKNISYFFTGSRQYSNGYRDDTFYKIYDFTGKIGVDLDTGANLRFEAGMHQSIYGLPGGVSESDIANFGRKYAKYPDDFAKDRSFHFLAGGAKDLDGFGEVSADISYTKKISYSSFPGGNGGWNPVKINYTHTVGVTPKYRLCEPAFGHKNTLITGVDYYFNNFSSNDYDLTHVPQDAAGIYKISLGGYAQDEFAVFKDLTLIGGYRYEGVKYKFDSVDFTGFNSPTESKIYPNEKAFNGGLNYCYKEDSSLYVNANQSFRFPLTDDFFNGTLNTDLKPQVSRSYEAGIRHKFNEHISSKLSAYIMNLKDELFTDPFAFFGLGQTANYDHTQRRGTEFSSGFKANEKLSMDINYCYIDSHFRSGAYSGNTVPMAPWNKANASLRYRPWQYITLNLSENYTGEQYRINDTKNTLPRLKNYYTTDVGLSFEKNGFTASASINNLLGAKYYEYASVSQWSGNKLFYPAPGRNFMAKAGYKF